MPQSPATVDDPFARLDRADVIFLSQDGYRLAPARVRCYHFAQALAARGLRCEVLSFFDHLGASDQGGPVAGIPEEEKIRLNLRAYDLLSRNPTALLYVQKTGYHMLAVALAAARNGNPYVIDYDDYDLDGRPFRGLERFFPCLAPGPLLTNMLAGARACVVSSHSILDLVAPLNPETHLVHTVADAALFSHERRSAIRQRFGDAVNILWCGDVWGDIPMRDILFAIDAFALLPRATRLRARFHVIGFGRAWEELKRRVRMRHPDLDGVLLHEHIPHDQFGAVLAEMDIGVLPYADNRFNAAKSPTKMFEYLLAGVVVCATPVGEATRCLSDGKTALFADGLQGFADSLARLIDDGGLRRRIADAAHAVAMERYTLQGVAGRLDGVVRAAMRSAPTTPTVDAFLAQELGRTRRVAPREVEIAREDLRLVLGAGDPVAVDPRRWSAPLLALLRWPGLQRGEGVAPEQAERLLQIGQSLRHAARLRGQLAHVRTARPQGPPSLCKLAAAEDWDDPRWFPWLTRFKTSYATFRPDDRSSAEVAAVNDDELLNQTCNYYKRSRGAWERVQLLYGLDRLGRLDGARIAVLSTHVDGIYLFLTEMAAHVDVIDAGGDAAAHAAHVERGDIDPWLMKPRLFDRRRVTVHHVGAAGLDRIRERWDVVIALSATVTELGTDRVFAWATEAIHAEGVVAVTADVVLNGRHGAEFTDIPAAARTWGGLVPVGRFDNSISDATLDRVVVSGTAGTANPHFVTRSGPALVMPGAWVFRKQGAGGGASGTEAP